MVNNYYSCKGQLNGHETLLKAHRHHCLRMATYVTRQYKYMYYHDSVYAKPSLLPDHFRFAVAVLNIWRPRSR